MILNRPIQDQRSRLGPRFSAKPYVAIVASANLMVQEAACGILSSTVRRIHPSDMWGIINRV